jgi:hypothetical protein
LVKLSGAVTGQVPADAGVDGSAGAGVDRGREEDGCVLRSGWRVSRRNLPALRLWPEIALVSK